MTPPPLPPGCEGYPVAPNIHTAAIEEPERDGWGDIKRDRLALETAVLGLHKLQANWADVADAEPEAFPYAGYIVSDLSALLDKIGATR